MQLAISCAALTLLHRYFTFRSAEKWYVALPFMVGAWLLWSFSNAIFSPYLINAGSDELAAYTQLSPALWIVLQYLLQRYVLYVHTVDTNGWYRRSHPTNDA